ncbi:phosphatase PAP2 family protein [Natronococcus sp. JC468]|uniref:phosphatase PAP2 family protein n=1 Tax=Natronococcus sp. JC468 TaxID=1961921 RepID=UPI0014387A24|nr:phosphatase PAP2 family protein [Natronococcus sp. JC468]NKE37861.1 phosphatase PAP2 family protein [Natronococcus sp. JC468]
MWTLSDGRGVGLTDALHGSAHEPVVVLFALLTQLSDVWFLFVLCGVYYVAGERFPRWGIERRRGLFVFGLLLTYIALIGVLKQFFVLPRPPGASSPPDLEWIPLVARGVVADMATATGYGFPSGHALGSTLVWGGFALVVGRDRRSRARFALAGVVIAVVSLARLVLGVHYLVDVVAGVLIGLLALGALYGIAAGGTEPARVLVVAVGIGTLGLGYGLTFESVAAVGSGVGAWLVWRAVTATTSASPSSRREVAAALVVFGLAGSLFALLYALEPPLSTTFFGAAVAAGGVVGAPLIGERLVERTRTIQTNAS